MKLRIMLQPDPTLRALRLLETDGRKMQASALALKLDSTASYLPQVLGTLVRVDWLASEPGPGGGYRLAERLNDRSLLELIELIEGPADDGSCVLRKGECSPDAQCAPHAAWQESRDALLARLSTVSISQHEP